MNIKKITSILLVIVTLISVVGSLSFFSFANEVEVVATRGLGISSGTDYFIMNYSSRLMAPNSSNQSDYVSVVTWNPAIWNESRLQWQVNKQSDGTYKLWGFGGSGTILRGFLDNLSVEVECDENDESVRFEIQRIDYVIEENGTYNDEYEGMYIIKCYDYYVAENNNTLVVLKEEFDSSCCWSFMAVEQRFAGLSSNFEAGPNTTVNDNKFINNFEEYGYMAYTYWDYHTPENFLESLTEDDIFIYVARTSTASLDFYELDGSVYYRGSFTVDYESDRSRQNQCYASDLAPNSLCLSRCIIYLGNNTGADCIGKDGCSYNLVDETYDKGAHYVLGINGTMTTNEKNIWIAAFLDSIDSGKNITQAVYAAQTTVDTENGEDELSFSIYHRGDGRQHLNW